MTSGWSRIAASIVRWGHPWLAALLLLPLEAMRDYMLEPPGYFRQLLETLLMFFASGAFWALVGLTFATLTNSRYMAYASPFVLFEQASTVQLYHASTLASMYSSLV